MTLPPESKMMWDDIVEGNSCEVEGLLKIGGEVYITPGIYKTKWNREKHKSEFTDEIRFGTVV